MAMESTDVMANMVMARDMDMGMDMGMVRRSDSRANILHKMRINKRQNKVSYTNLFIFSNHRLIIYTNMESRKSISI